MKIIDVNKAKLKNECDIELKALTKDIKDTSIDDSLNMIFENSREFYKKISEKLTVEERLFILENLKNKSCNTCDNGSCGIGVFEKGGVDAEEKPEGHSCIGWYNSELIGKSKILRITDIYKLK